MQRYKEKPTYAKKLLKLELHLATGAVEGEEEGVFVLPEVEGSRIGGMLPET